MIFSQTFDRKLPRGDVLQLLEALGESVWQRDLATESVVFTEGLWTRLGYGESEMPRTLPEALAYFDPDDADRVLREMADYLSDEKSYPYRSAAKVRAASGNWRCLRFTGVVMDRDDANNPRVVGGLVSDITEDIAMIEAQKRAKSRISKLTQREKQTFDEIVAGSTSKEIGLRLGLSPKTVDFYRSRMMDKLGVSRTAELLRLAADAGLLRETN